MNDIQQIVDNFLRAAERLERLTVDINVMADQLEPTLRGAGQVKSFDNNPVAVDPGVAARYGTPPAPPQAPVGLPSAEMLAESAAALARMQQPLGQSPAPAYSMPQSPQGAAPSSATPPAAPTASAVEVEGPGAATPETPRPAGPAQPGTPWEAQAAAPAAPPAEKKKGRRTHEELAADAGVDLAAVKEWLGGKKVTKAGIDEFVAANPHMVRATPADAPVQPSNPFGGSPQPNPVTQQAAPVPVPAAPVTPQGAPVPQQQWAMQPDGQPAPVAAPQQQWAQPQPVAAPPADVGEQFGDWAPVEGGFDPSNPFGG
jgi:hypothetical protein